jgi:hypothetical protein
LFATEDGAMKKPPDDSGGFFMCMDRKMASLQWLLTFLPVSMTGALIFSSVTMSRLYP